MIRNKKSECENYDIEKIMEQFLSKEGISLETGLKLYRTLENVCLKPEHRDHATIYHEIYPTLKISEHLGESCIKLKFSGKELSYDAEIETPSYSQKIEFTRAATSDNLNDPYTAHTEHLHRELIKERGYGGTFGKTIKYEIKKTTNGRIKEFSDNPIIFEEVSSVFNNYCNEILKMIKISYKNKLDSKYEGYWLGITINDLPIDAIEFDAMQKKKNCLANIFDNWWRIYKHEYSNTALLFKRIFIIGTSSRVNFFWDSNPT